MSEEYDIGKRIDLTREWDHFYKLAWDKKFDYNGFCMLAKETFQFLSRFNDEEFIPKDLVNLMLVIGWFAEFDEWGFSKECEIAVRIAGYFIDMFVQDCVEENGEGFFEFELRSGEVAKLDVNTFSYSHLLK